MGHCFGAVSYTHLDVYKRQVLERLSEHTFFETAKMLYVPAALLDYKFSPVSYTHLDVYKRQVSGRNVENRFTQFILYLHGFTGKRLPILAESRKTEFKRCFMGLH